MNTFPNCTQKTTLGIMYEVNQQNKRLIIDTDNQGVQQKLGTLHTGCRGDQDLKCMGSHVTHSYVCKNCT